MKKNNEKLKQLPFVELYNILNFLKEEYAKVDDNEKDIIKERINATEEELKRIVNNLF